MEPARYLVPAERIERSILFIRGQKVMLDKDLAELYGVESKAFNRALCHNLSCVIHSQCELGIEPIFWSEGKDGEKVVILPMVRSR